MIKPLLIFFSVVGVMAMVATVVLVLLAGKLDNEANKDENAARFTNETARQFFSGEGKVIVAAEAKSTVDEDPPRVVASTTLTTNPDAEFHVHGELEASSISVNGELTVKQSSSTISTYTLPPVPPPSDGVARVLTSSLNFNEKTEWHVLPEVTSITTTAATSMPGELVKFAGNDTMKVEPIGVTFDDNTKVLKGDNIDIINVSGRPVDDFIQPFKSATLVDGTTAQHPTDIEVRTLNVTNLNGTNVDSLIANTTGNLKSDATVAMAADLQMNGHSLIDCSTVEMSDNGALVTNSGNVIIRPTSNFHGTKGNCLIDDVHDCEIVSFGGGISIDADNIFIIDSSSGTYMRTGGNQGATPEDKAINFRTGDGKSYSSGNVTVASGDNTSNSAPKTGLTSITTGSARDVGDVNVGTGDVQTGKSGDIQLKTGDLHSAPESVDERAGNVYVNVVNNAEINLGTVADTDMAIEVQTNAVTLATVSVTINSSSPSRNVPENTVVRVSTTDPSSTDFVCALPFTGRHGNVITVVNTMTDRDLIVYNPDESYIVTVCTKEAFVDFVCISDNRWSLIEPVKSSTAQLIQTVTFIEPSGYSVISSDYVRCWLHSGSNVVTLEIHGLNEGTFSSSDWTDFGQLELPVGHLWRFTEPVLATCDTVPNNYQTFQYLREVNLIQGNIRIIAHTGNTRRATIQGKASPSTSGLYRMDTASEYSPYLFHLRANFQL